MVDSTAPNLPESPLTQHSGVDDSGTPTAAAHAPLHRIQRPWLLRHWRWGLAATILILSVVLFAPLPFAFAPWLGTIALIVVVVGLPVLAFSIPWAILNPPGGEPDMTNWPADAVAAVRRTRRGDHIANWVLGIGFAAPLVAVLVFPPLMLFPLLVVLDATHFGDPLVHTPSGDAYYFREPFLGSIDDPGYGYRAIGPFFMERESSITLYRDETGATAPWEGSRATGQAHPSNPADPGSRATSGSEVPVLELGMPPWSPSDDTVTVVSTDGGHTFTTRN